MSVKPIPEGFRSITPFLVVKGASGLIDFLKTAFGATELFRMDHPDGSVMHAEITIGDSIVMLGEAMKEFPPIPCMLYLYVADVDATYRAALDAGAESMEEPKDQFWGDRAAGVTDPAGNKWWIATHVEDVVPEELARRAKEAQPECK
ncbi:MAG: VOC family protein [Desulfomonile tiedjei]|nr:VOC family protein [Desulfomonile tiedjei]